MGFNMLHKNSAPQQGLVSAENEVRRIPHRFILQHVCVLFKNRPTYRLTVK
jgi:hypothetical protein